MDWSEQQKAVRLLYKGLNPRASAAQDRDYAELLSAYEASLEFRDQVFEMATAIDVRVIGATAKQILLRPAGPDSQFNMTISAFKGSTSARNGLLAMVLVAVAAAFFRTGNDLLKSDPYPLSIEQMEQILTELCEALAKKVEGVDPRKVPDEQIEVWRIFLQLQRHVEGEIRGGFRSRTQVIRQVVNVLESQNLLREATLGSQAAYLPTERFRQQLKQSLSHDVFEQCIRMLVPAFNSSEIANV